MRTEPWWCCTCGVKIYRVGKGRGSDKKWLEHLKVCPLSEVKKRHPNMYVCQGLHIKQMPQGKP